MPNPAKTQIQNITTILSNDQNIVCELYSRGLALADMDLRLKKCLDPDLNKNFQLANINHDAAVLIVNSSVWASRLRYNIPTILKIFNTEFYMKNIKSIRIKIKQPTEKKTISNQRPFTMSAKSAHYLNEVANSCNDPEFACCFKKLSKNKL